MTKYLTVPTCLDCPYVSVDDNQDKYLCYNAGETIGETTDIPEWCPLPELEEHKRVELS